MGWFDAALIRGFFARAAGLNRDKLDREAQGVKHQGMASLVNGLSLVFRQGQIGWHISIVSSRSGIDRPGLFDLDIPAKARIPVAAWAKSISADVPASAGRHIELFDGIAQ